jgi:hypothetical protein
MGDETWEIEPVYTYIRNSTQDARCGDPPPTYYI